MPDESNYTRLYAADVGLNPAIFGATDVQAALGLIPGPAPVLLGAVDTGGTVPSFRVTAPLSLAAIHSALPPQGHLAIPLPPQVIGVGGIVAFGIGVAYPAFAAPVATDVEVSVFITDAAGTNTLFSHNVKLATVGPGAVVANTQALDFTAHPPAIVGADLSAAGGSITSAAGGVYRGVVLFDIVFD